MPTDSVKNIERAFTGRCPTVIFDNDTPINQVSEIINYRDIFNKVKPANSFNPTLSIALETLQLISYLPGLYKPHKLPEYDEDLTPLLQRQTQDLEWMAEFSPSTQYAIEISIFESFYNNSTWGQWRPVARKWLYNQGTEYYLDLISPFLSDTRKSDIGDINYRLGVAITKKPTQLTAKAVDNYIRIRCAYSGIITYEQPPQSKNLTRNSGSRLLTVDSSIDVLSYNPNRKILYLQNTGKSVVYYNFGDSISTPENCLYLLPNESLSYEGDKVDKRLPLTEYLINEPLHIFTEGKNAEGETVTINKVSFIEFYEV